MHNISIGDTVVVTNLCSSFYGRKFDVTRIEWPSSMWAQGNEVDPILIYVLDDYCGRKYELCFKYNEVEKVTSFDSASTIKKVIFNPPATIVFWSDGSKTIVKANENDIFDPEKGLAMAISKKVLGNKGNYYNTFKRFIPDKTIDLDVEFNPNTTLSEAIEMCAERLKKVWGIE